MKHAQIDTATGFVNAVNDFPVADEFLPAGVTQVEVEADVSGTYYDAETGEFHPPPTEE